MLVELKKTQLTAQKRDKTIQEYIRLLNLTNSKYQKLFEENKILKEKIEVFEKEKNIKRQKITKKKRQYKVRTDSKEEDKQRETQEEKG